MDNYNEAIVVNKFKKTMTLYNAGNRKVDVLVPRHPSAGNRLEKQSGNAVFFFSTIEEAKKYAVGKGITVEYNEYISEVRKQIASMKKSDPEKAEIATKHMAFISKVTRNGKAGNFPPVFHVIGTHMKYYGLDDRKICPEFPFCWNFIERLKQSKMPMYIRIANVPTEDIKHGHSSNYREFTVFKQVKVDECKEFTLGELFRQTNVTYFTRIKDYSKYMRVVTKNADKDIFRAIITYANFRKRLEWDADGKHGVPNLETQEENTIIMKKNLIKLLESSIVIERKWGTLVDELSDNENFVITEALDDTKLYQSKSLVYSFESSIREFSVNVFNEDLSNKLSEKLNEIHDNVENCNTLEEVYKYKKQLNIINNNINKKLVNNNNL